jgi:hypothetical protein
VLRFRFYAGSTPSPGRRFGRTFDSPDLLIFLLAEHRQCLTSELRFHHGFLVFRESFDCWSSGTLVDGVDARNHSV